MEIKIKFTDPRSENIYDIDISGLKASSDSFGNLYFIGELAILYNDPIDDLITQERVFWGEHGSEDYIADYGFKLIAK